MYRYKLDNSFEKIPLEINIVKAPLNDKGFADLLSINLEYTCKLNRAKNRINEYNSSVWEEVKKHTNPYEFIYAFNSKHKGNDYRSVSMIKPLSRSFFKMIEMIHEFCPHILNENTIKLKDKDYQKNRKKNKQIIFEDDNDEDNEDNKEDNFNNKIINNVFNDTEIDGTSALLPILISVHIAEGPGGFIEAVRFVRKGKYDDHAFGMTLIDDKYTNKETRDCFFKKSYQNKPVHESEALANKTVHESEALANKTVHEFEILANKGARGAEALALKPLALKPLALKPLALKPLANKTVHEFEILANKGARGAEALALKPLVPGWKQSNHFLLNNPEVHIINGADGTGDIYKPENINFLNNEMREVGEGFGAHLITADGGFDFSIEYNYQEQSSCKLIFSQILSAIKCQRIGGTFICKFFDINLYFTVEMLYLLYSVYETVFIYKPFTSRIANSEKYIICSNFRGIDPILCNNLFDVLNQWNKYNSETINQMFKEIPILFIERIKEINMEIVDSQINSINNAINIIKKQKYVTNSYIYSSEMTVEKQIKYAKDWCKRYNIPYKY